VKALDCQMRYESSWADLTKSVPRPSVALPLCTHRGCRLRTDRMRGICVWRDAHSAQGRAVSDSWAGCAPWSKRVSHVRHEGVPECSGTIWGGGEWVCRADELARWYV
jgi:hypothetical protein